MVRTFVEAWEEAGVNFSEGAELMVAMARHLGDETPIGIEVVMPPDSVENILAAVMRRLHRERHDAEGWTHFSIAGQVARRESPDLPKKGLLDIAHRVEGFQFEQRPAGTPNAVWTSRPTS